MPISLAASLTFLEASTAYLGAALYSALHPPRTNYVKQVRECIAHDIEYVLKEAKTESRTIPEEWEYPVFARAFHNGLINGYERPWCRLSLPGRLDFLESAYLYATDRGSTYHIFEENPKDRGKMNPRQIPLEEIMELAKTTFAEWAGVDSNPIPPLEW